MMKAVVGTVACGLCLAVVACESTISNPVSPTPLDGGAAPEGPALTGSPAGSTEPVIRLSDSAQVGTARILRTPNGVSFNLSTSDLMPEHAYTLWFVVFNAPAECATPHACAPDDVVNGAAQPDLIYAAGSVVGGAGTAMFAGHVKVGDTSGSINAPVGLPAFALIDPLGAEIHLAVHHHGPKLPEHMPDMTQTIDGGCTDAGIPTAGAISPWNQHRYGSAGPNTCATIQAVVFRP